MRTLLALDASLVGLACLGAVHCGGATTDAAGTDAADDDAVASTAEGGVPPAPGPDATPDDARTGDGCAPSSRAMLHRAQASTCAMTPPDAGVSVDGGPLSDQCLSDSDCGDSGVCSCRGNTFGWAHESYGNSCVPSNCRSDSDCGPGGVCSPTVTPGCGPFYGIVGYYCHTCADQCENDGDCPVNPSGPGPAGYCAFDPTVGYWACGYGFCAG